MPLSLQHRCSRKKRATLVPSGLAKIERTKPPFVASAVKSKFTVPDEPRGHKLFVGRSISAQERTDRDHVR
jgi:hypothetical protein